MAKELEPQLKTEMAAQLYEAVAALNQPEKVATFLRDLLTLEELDEAIRRFEVAKLLSAGKTVREIAKATKMSSATIVRINYWLHHGMGGYGLALEKLKL